MVCAICIVPMSPVIELVSFVSRRPEMRLGGVPPAQDSNVLEFVAENGKVKYGFHALRHTAASLFIAPLG
jgi:hypothetical protein